MAQLQRVSDPFTVGGTDMDRVGSGDGVSTGAAALAESEAAAVAEAEAIAAGAAAEVAAEAAVTARAAVVAAQAAAGRASAQARRVAQGVEATEFHADAQLSGPAATVSEATATAAATAAAAAVTKIAMAVEVAAALVAAASVEAIALVAQQLGADEARTATALHRSAASASASAPVAEPLQAAATDLPEATTQSAPTVPPVATAGSPDADWADLVARHTAPGEPGLWRDIALAVRMDAAVRDDEAWFEAVFDDAPVAMAVVDPTGLGTAPFRHVNRAFAALTGYPVIRLLALAPGDLEQPDQGPAHAATDGGVFRRWLHADGHVVPVRVRTATVRVSGRADAVICIVDALADVPHASNGPDISAAPAPRPVTRRESRPVERGNNSGDQLLLQADLAYVAEQAGHDAVEQVTCLLVRAVNELGGWCVPERFAPADALHLDLSLGRGEPLLPVAPSGGDARTAMERVLPDLLEQVRARLLGRR